MENPGYSNISWDLTQEGKRNSFLAGYYMFKVNYRNTKTRREICSKLTTKTPERHHWCEICSKLKIKTLEQRQ